jgi:hypothetical protein
MRKSLNVGVVPHQKLAQKAHQRLNELANMRILNQSEGNRSPQI